MAIYSVRDLTLASEIDKLDRYVRDIKSDQPSGNDISTVKESTTAAAFDLTVAVAPSSSSSTQIARYFWLDSDDTNRLQGTVRFQLGLGSIGNSVTDASKSTLIQALPQGSNTRRILFNVNLYNYSTSQILYVKAYFYASATGTVSFGTSMP